MHYGNWEGMMNKLCTENRHELIIDGKSAIRAIDSYTLACLRGETGYHDVE